MRRAEKYREFTHQEYRCAKVVHMVNQDQEILFYHHGKSITKEIADAITEKYLEEKQKRNR